MMGQWSCCTPGNCEAIASIPFQLGIDLIFFDAEIREGKHREEMNRNLVLWLPILSRNQHVNVIRPNLDTADMVGAKSPRFTKESVSMSMLLTLWIMWGPAQRMGLWKLFVMKIPPGSQMPLFCELYTRIPRSILSTGRHMINSSALAYTHDL